MEGLTDYITKSDWEDILTVAFVLIDDAWPLLPRETLPPRRRGPAPALTTTFDLDKLGSRSFSGMVAQAITRVLAYTLSFFLAEILTPDVIAYQPC